MRKLAYFLQITIGAFFIAASLGKLPLINAVVNEIDAYQIVPVGSAQFFALLLIAYEFSMGVWLLINRKANYALAGLFTLLSIFIVAKASAEIRGLDIVCNTCFGTLLSLPMWANLVVNVGLMIAIGFIYWQRAKSPIKERYQHIIETMRKPVSM